jgi:hypothetical protein
MVHLIPEVMMTLYYSMILVKLFCRTEPGEHPIGGHHGVTAINSGDYSLLLHGPGFVQDTAR